MSYLILFACGMVFGVFMGWDIGRASRGTMRVTYWNGSRNTQDRDNRTTVKLVGGPLDGLLHKLRGEFPCPDRLGLPDNGKLHWYKRLTDDTAEYERSEQRHAAREADNECEGV